MTTLLPCPMCGGEAEILPNRKLATVACTKGCVMTQQFRPDDNSAQAYIMATERAMDAWNTRRTAEKMQAALDIAKRALENCKCISTEDEGTSHYIAAEALGRIRELMEENIGTTINK